MSNTIKKYILSGTDVIMREGIRLHRIIATKDIYFRHHLIVPKGTKGGYIQDDSNLSHEGSCFIYDDAIVATGSVVSEHAIVKNNAIVEDRCKIRACGLVENWARVRGNCTIEGIATVKNNATVKTGCVIADRSIVKDNSSMRLYCYIKCDSIIQEFASITDVHMHKTSVVGGYSIVKRVSIGGAVLGDALVEGYSSWVSEVNGTVKDSAKIKGYFKIDGLVGGSAKISGGSCREEEYHVEKEQKLYSGEWG